MKQKILLGMAVIAVIVVGISGIYAFTSKGTTTHTQQLVSQGQSVHQVTIKNFTFSPATMAISAGTAVTWTNDDAVAHTATANNGSFNTGVIDPHQSKTIVFQNPGTFAYHCTIHPRMMGTIVVK